MQRTGSYATLLASLFAVSLAAQDQTQRSGSLLGVWRVTEVTTTGPGGRHIADHRPGLLVITGRHLALIVEAGDKPRPEQPPSSADEFRAVWGPLVAFAGSYQATANELTVTIAVHKTPANMRPGSFMTWTYSVTGDTLTRVTLRTHEGASKNPITWKLARTE